MTSLSDSCFLSDTLMISLSISLVHSAVQLSTLMFLTHLVVPASFLNAGKADDGFAVLYGLVEDGVRVTLDCLLLTSRSTVVLLHLPPLDRLQSLMRKGKRHSDKNVFNGWKRLVPVTYLRHDSSCQDLFAIFHEHVNELAVEQELALEPEAEAV